MNPLDSLMLAIAPERGLRRIQARARAKAVMNYDAASRGRRTHGWSAPDTDADSAARASRERLRNLSRDMIRNRPFAARAQHVITGNVVGAGILPSVVSDDEATRDRVMSVLRRHLMTPALDSRGQHDLRSMQRLIMNAVFCDGEAFVRRRIRAGRFANGLALPFQVELLEPDHLNTTMTSWGDNRVVEGVEIGPTGRVEAYHLYEHHPGDMAWTANRSLQSRRVSAAEVLHIRRFDRVEQHRGVPWLSPVMMTLGEISDYQEAQILKQRMAALLAAVVTSSDDDTQFNGKGIESLAPGAVVGLEPGQDIRFTEPPKVDGYGEFMGQALRAVAMGLGVTYESLSGDLREVNFSSARMGRMEMDRLIETWQQQIMVAQFCAGIERWVREAWAMGEMPTGWSLEWTAPRRALVDPTKEIPAMLKAIEGGLVSRQRTQRQLGYDPATIRQERIDDATGDAEDGITTPAASPQIESEAESEGGDASQ